MDEEEYDMIYEDTLDEVLVNEEEIPSVDTSSAKRRLLEDRLEERRLQKQIQGFDFDLD